EWAILENLRDVLQAFKDATLFCSRNTATLASVIPAMDKLDLVLASSVLKKVDKQIQFTAPVKISLLAAKKTLNHYYVATDNSCMYQLAIVLHPCYKLSYFQQHGWEDEEVETAHLIATDMF
ncbi:hypothetical protein BT96DRAFT_746594, partial [Gymnopus androsaceus JB14]